VDVAYNVSTTVTNAKGENINIINSRNFAMKLTIIHFYDPSPPQIINL
jgi:hypothetical protein